MTPELNAVLAESLALLQEGAANPGSAWRHMALATVGLDGTPQVRTVVLRRVDPGARLLEIHTDRRSPKYAELTARPMASLHGWDPGPRVQLRASGPVSLHHGDPVADAAWETLWPATRKTYRAHLAPGTPIAAPGLPADASDDAARAVFCVVRLRIDRLEHLHLGQGSHRRACFRWENEHPHAMWLVP